MSEAISPLFLKIGSHGCCGMAEIGGFVPDYRIEDCVQTPDSQPYRNPAYKMCEVEAQIISEIARVTTQAKAERQTLIIATTNTLQTFAAKCLSELGFISSKPMAKPKLKGKGFIQLHYLQLTTGERTK